eukprot:scaffold7488_cov37-Tisochrysis_lutea.AAC.1
MQRDETTVGFQEEEESSDKANALSNNSDPLPLQAESAGKSMEDIMLAARPVEVHTLPFPHSLRHPRAWPAS